MTVSRSLSDAAVFAPSAVTIGNFDGVHLGHQHLFRNVVAAARQKSVRPVVLTFDPHPAKIVAPDRAPRLLTSPEERCALIHEQGISDVLILPFTAEIARLSAAEFVDGILVRTLGAKVVLVGDNFRFGHKQSGDTNVLTELGTRYHYETRIVGSVESRGRIVSSSEIRRQIENGDVAMACRFLNRPYSIAGSVVRGHGVGSKQTVPTLNLETRAEILPRTGVYVTRTHDLNGTRAWNSITNVGYRPTFGADDTLSIETFLLEPLTGATPANIRVQFLQRVRDEKKFENAGALRTQILRDVGAAQKFFRRSVRWRRTAAIQ